MFQFNINNNGTPPGYPLSIHTPTGAFREIGEGTRYLVANTNKGKIAIQLDPSYKAPAFLFTRLTPNPIAFGNVMGNATICVDEENFNHKTRRKVGLFKTKDCRTLIRCLGSDSLPVDIDLLVDNNADEFTRSYPYWTIYINSGGGLGVFYENGECVDIYSALTD